MSDKEKENRVFYVTHSLELLIWLVIFLVIIASSTIFFIVRHESRNVHRIFLPDVDGLIVGSPVRMMGIQVGHVVKVKPVRDQVYVKFLIEDDDIKIPQGTQATVEFSGMAGSKSLELYLPDKKTYVDETVPTITVNPPKRLHDVFGLLNDMFHRIGSMITTSSQFGKQLQAIELPETGTPGDAKEFLKFADKTIDAQTKRLEDFEKRIKKYEQ